MIRLVDQELIDRVIQLEKENRELKQRVTVLNDYINMLGSNVKDIKFDDEE